MNKGAEELGIGGLEETREEMRDLREYDLSDHLEEVVERYEDVDSPRDRFVWKWFHSIAPSFTVPSVDQEFYDEVMDKKTTAAIFTTLLDDLVEKRGDSETFEEVAKIPFDHKQVDKDRAGVDEEYIQVTEDIWEYLESDIEGAPREEEFRDWLDYDFEQVVNAVRHAERINEDPLASNPIETERFDTYNMIMYPSADIDLMHSSEFDHGEYGDLREVVDRAQRMARIGNWLSTWEREIEEGDYTSGVVVRAIDEEVVTPEELQRAQESEEVLGKLIGNIREAGIEDDLRQEWLEYRQEAYDLAEEIDSVDMEQYVEGMNEVMRDHLASHGMK
jgi:hypothetical protein